MTKTKILLDDLTEDEAYALAQMCKRMRWEHFKELSASQAELHVMDLATLKLRRVLAEAGFDPRWEPGPSVSESK
jgi:hypothetical protein